MANNPFKQATRENLRLRLAVVGPSGSGKTWTALGLAQQLGQRVAVIDSESGSASRYADTFDFDVLELQSGDPRRYVEAIQAAVSAGYDVVVIDSLTHAWSGEDGVLDQVDREASQRRGGNSWAGWAKGTPLHRQLLRAILSAQIHVIATMRSKAVWRLEDDGAGRRVPTLAGETPDQRAGVEYEFDVVANLDHEHRASVSKARSQIMDGQVYDHPCDELAVDLAGWLGVPLLTWQAAEASVRQRLADAQLEVGQVMAFLLDTGRGDLTKVSPRLRDRLVDSMCRNEQARAKFRAWLADQTKQGE